MTRYHCESDASHTYWIGFDPKSRGRDNRERKHKFNSKTKALHKALCKQMSSLRPDHQSSRLHRFNGGVQSSSSVKQSSSEVTNDDSYSESDAEPSSESDSLQRSSSVLPKFAEFVLLAADSVWLIDEDSTSSWGTSVVDNSSEGSIDSLEQRTEEWEKWRDELDIDSDTDSDTVRRQRLDWCERS